MFLFCGWSRLVSADAVTDWNENAGEAAKAACISPDDDPLHESRMYAMVHIAIHDALNAIDRRSRPYTFDSQAPSGASADAAVAAAAHDVLVALINQLPPISFPQDVYRCGSRQCRSRLYRCVGRNPEWNQPRRKVLRWTKLQPQLSSRSATNDGSDTLLIDTAYPARTAPGEWRFTPGFPFAFAPGWADVTPFVLNDAAQYQSGASLQTDQQEVRGRSQRSEKSRR